MPNRRNEPTAPPASLPSLSLAMPHQIWLADNLLGLWFPLMKILPAVVLVESVAVDRGIIETSSGTMALALAMVCAPLRHPLTLVTPPLEISLLRHLRALGATVVQVSDTDTSGGNQAARLRVLQSILRQ